MEHVGLVMAKLSVRWIAEGGSARQNVGAIGLVGEEGLVGEDGG